MALKRLIMRWLGNVLSRRLIPLSVVIIMIEQSQENPNRLPRPVPQRNFQIEMALLANIRIHPPMPSPPPPGHRPANMSQIPLRKLQWFDPNLREQHQQHQAAQLLQHQRQPAHLDAAHLDETGVNAEFRVADYARAQAYFNQHSYCHKSIDQQTGQITYKRFQNLESNESFKQYSLGVYLYLDMLRILIWFYVVCTLLAGVQMYFNYQGEGLSSFQQTYMIITLKTSLGNNTTATFAQVLIQTLCDAGICILLVIFILYWRRRTANILTQVEEDMSILDPQKYAVSIIFKGTQPKVNEIMPFIDANFSKLYEVIVVYDFKRKFAKFEELDEFDTDIRMLQIKEKKSNSKQKQLQKLRAKRQKLYQQLSASDLKPTPMAYILHFMTLQDKSRFIKAMEKFASVDELYYNFKKAVTPCLVAKVPENYLLQGNLFPKIKERKFGRPEDIRWENLDISSGEKCIRLLIGGLFIIVVLAVASLTIAVCSIYVSATNDCSNFDPNTSLATAQASTDLTLVYCYCQKNIISYFQDPDLYSLCQAFSKDILVKTFLQFVAAAISTITNILIAVLVGLLISFMKPRSNSDALVTNFVSILLATLINSVTIPLLLNASIFGGRPVLFFSWINFTNLGTIISYSDFSRTWYAYVAPFYLNFFLIAITTPWINLIKVSVLQCLKRLRLKNSEGETLQKLMNRDIIDYTFNLPTEAASILLYLFFSLLYSSCLPILVPLTLFILISQYTASKIILTKYSRQVPANEDINEKVIKYMPWAIVLHLLFAIWSFTCPEIFSGELFDNMRLNMTYFNNELDRVFNIPYLSGFVILLVGMIVIDFLLIRPFIWLATCCGGDAAEQARFARQKIYSERLKMVNILGSYNITKNPEYKTSMHLVNEILRNPFKFANELNDTQKPLGVSPLENLQHNDKKLMDYFRGNMPSCRRAWTPAEMQRISEGGKEPDNFSFRQ